jgi:hypothetical protein
MVSMRSSALRFLVRADQLAWRTEPLLQAETKEGREENLGKGKQPEPVFTVQPLQESKASFLWNVR